MLAKQVITLAQLLGKEDKHRSSSPDDLFSTTHNASPRIHEFYWRKGERAGVELPLVAVPFDGDVESFYADVATYYPDMSPISAYMHVLSSEFIALSELPDLSKAIRKIRYPSLECPEHRIWIALSITEAASYLFTSSTRAEGGVTYSICRRSLSFTLARAGILYPKYPRKKVVEKWLQLRGLTKMEFSPEISASISWIADVAFDSSSPVLGSKGQHSDLAEMIHRMIDQSLSLPQFEKYLADIYPSVSANLHILAGDYDGRMQGLTKIIDDVRMHSRGPELDAITIAFFCNNILPGSLTHMKLLARVIGEYPSILIWYGFFSGLSEGFDWRRTMSGIGQKLSRDLRSPFSLENHQCADVALEELAVLARIGITADAIKPIQQRTMLVSLLPGIELLCRLPIEGGVDGRNAMQAARNEELDRQITARDKRLQHLLSEAQSLLNKGNARRTVPQNTRSEKPLPRKEARATKSD